MNLRWQKIASTLLVTFTLFPFQNCSKMSPQQQFANTASSVSETDGTGAHPYDGKIYSLFGALCADSTSLQSRIVFTKLKRAELIRKDCQDLPPTVLAPSEYQVSNSTLSLIYNGLTFSLTAPDAVGAGLDVSPKLASAVDPTAYGAIGDGVTDNTAAFVAALNVDDILIPDGIYVIKGTIRVPAGRSIQCKSIAAVTLLNPNLVTAGNHMFQFWSNGGSISNCHLTGAKSLNANGSATFDVSSQFNFLVSIVDYWGAVSHVTVANNLFENCHGNACVTVYGASGYGASKANIVNNTFKNCGYYGVVVDAGSNISVASNHLTDCSMTFEAQANPVQNVLEYNYLTVTHGNGKSFTLGDSNYLTGGTNGADYTTSVVRYNTVVGNGTPNSISILTQASLPSQYINNTCSNGCVLQ